MPTTIYWRGNADTDIDNKANYVTAAGGTTAISDFDPASGGTMANNNHVIIQNRNATNIGANQP